MDWELSPNLDDPTEVVSIDKVKAELRITDSIQDDKIQNQINSAINEFENQTGFILRAGTLKINFSYQNNISHQRGKQNYISRFTSGASEPFRGFTGNTSPITYKIPLGAECIAQKPKSFSFNNSDNEFVNLTQNEINNLLPDNFFFPKNKKPLIFSLNGNFNDLISQKKFAIYASNITMDISISAGKNFSGSGIDIQMAIIRMVSKMFENPDVSINYWTDSFIVSVLQRYNMRLGL